MSLVSTHTLAHCNQFTAKQQKNKGKICCVKVNHKYGWRRNKVGMQMQQDYPTTEDRSKETLEDKSISFFTTFLLK